MPIILLRAMSDLIDSEHRALVAAVSKKSARPKD